MRGRAFLGAVVLLSVLVATAPAAHAQNVSGQLEVASQHTTFGTGSGESSPATLTNASVSGSGTSASVSFGTEQTVYNPFDDEGDGASDNNRQFLGDDSGNTVYNTEVQIQPDTSTEITALKLNIGATSGATTDITVDVYLVQEAPDQTYGEGTKIVSDYSPTWSTGEQTIPLDSSVSVSSGTTYTLEFVTSGDNDGSGDWLAVQTDDSAGSAWLTNSQFGTFNEYADVGLVRDSVQTSAQYVGANHSAENIQEVTYNLTISNGDADLVAEYWDGSSWVVANSTTVSSDGNHTVGVSATADTWRANVTVTSGSGTTTAELHDETVLFDASAPSGSNPDPADGSDVESYDGDVSLDVNDSDFATAQGDTVTVTLKNATGSQLNQTTVNSNGTVSFDYSALAGENDLTWELEDSYGQSSSVDQTFNTPAVLEIRNETKPQNLIDSPDANLTVTFFGANSDTVETVPVNGGKADLSGLPADEEFVAVITADNYHARRIVIPSLFEQQVAYLLPETATSADIVFTLDDRTGNFPGRETRLYIEKAINVSGSTDYRVISADTFGASGEYATTLQDSTRYRLRVENEDGDTRVLGSYTTAGNDAATLPIGDVSIGSTIDKGTVFKTGYQTGETGQKYVRVTYNDPADNTTDIEYNVTTGDGTTVATVDQSGSFGEYRATHPVPNNTTDATVNYTVIRGSGSNQETLSGQQTIGDVGTIDLPVDEQVLSLMAWIFIFGLTGIVVIWDARLSTLIGVGAASILTAVGWVQIPSMALGLAGVMAVFFNVGRGGGR